MYETYYGRIICILSIILLTLQVTPVYAGTKEIYEQYNINYKSSLDPEVSNIIRTANDAKIKASQYNNILSIQTFNNDVLTKLENEKLKYEKELLEGYGKPLDTILTLETQYLNAVKKYEDYKQKQKHEMEISLSIDNIPTQEEYCNALAQYYEYENSISFNDVPDTLPIEQYLNMYSKNNSSTFILEDKAPVRNMIPGIISNITDDALTVKSADYIAIRYKGFDSINVNIGDTVKQNDLLGVATDTLVVGMNINGKLVSIENIYSTEKEKE